MRTLFFIAAAAVGCGGGGGGGDPAGGPTLALIADSGGRVAWYRGAAPHELIAFDRMVDSITRNTGLFTMQPDGSGVFDVTGASGAVPAGFVGQPEWHPDGEHIVFQAENANSAHLRYNHVSWGIDNDLWIVRRDGTGAERIWESPPLHAALHPHFNAAGTVLVFAERVSTGVVLYPPSATPGGENPWAGWQIHVADFDMAGAGTGKLTNHRVLFGGGMPALRGFYETHGFRDDGTIVYSHTAGGAAYVDDCWTAGTDGSNPANLTASPTTWEEHAAYAPGGGAFAFISSRADSSWAVPGSDASTLRTELYLQGAAGVEALTDFNATGDPAKRYLVSDYDWDRSGRRIVLQVAPMRGLVPEAPQVWMLTLPPAP